jgi:class 3 adenylate cyclase
VSDAAKADQVLISYPVLDRIHLDGLQAGRRKRLRAEGAPRDIHVARISRA